MEKSCVGSARTCCPRYLYWSTAFRHPRCFLEASTSRRWRWKTSRTSTSSSVSSSHRPTSWAFQPRWEHAQHSPSFRRPWRGRRCLATVPSDGSRSCFCSPCFSSKAPDGCPTPCSKHERTCSTEPTWNVALLYGPSPRQSPCGTVLQNRCSVRQRLRCSANWASHSIGTHLFRSFVTTSTRARSRFRRHPSEKQGRTSCCSSRTVSRHGASIGTTNTRG